MMNNVKIGLINFILVIFYSKRIIKLKPYTIKYIKKLNFWDFYELKKIHLTNFYDLDLKPNGTKYFLSQVITGNEKFIIYHDIQRKPLWS